MACSKRLEQTLLRKGILTLNRFLPSGCDLSGDDTTASELGKGHDRGTIHVMTCSSLNHLDSTSLLPGDMAVTTSRIHVMAYLGRNKWIGAAPRRWRLRFS